MLLSEMFGVREGQLFTTENYRGYEFCIESCGGVEHVKVKRESGEWCDVNLTMMEILIHLAPAGIIHLPPPLTDEQREQLKALWTLGYRYLTKTTYLTIEAHAGKPRQVMDEWIQGGIHADVPYVSGGIYGLPIKNETEPYDIGKALGVEE